MQTTHNAVTDWKKGLGEALKLEPIYTVNLQRLLVRDDGRPLLFYASVNDVKEQNGRNLLVLETQIDIRATLRLVLECDPARAREVMEQRGPEFERYYAVVAQIRSVRKSADESASNRDNESGSASAESFVAEGRALDLLFVGAYGILRIWTSTAGEAHPSTDGNASLSVWTITSCPSHAGDSAVRKQPRLLRSERRIWVSLVDLYIYNSVYLTE
jgi:hypothetical protein